METIEKIFKLKEANSSVKQELIAALTTFVSISYMLFVIPSILSASGMKQGTIFTALVISSAIGSFIMGFLANYPIILAPTLGSASFFAYTVCQGMHINWQTALSGVLVASIIFVLITVLKLRELVIDAIPQDLKYAISAGIGIFIAFIGLRNAHIIVPSSSTMVALGSFKSAGIWIATFGLILTIILMCLNVPGSIFIGMICTAIFGIVLHQIPLPKEIISLPPSLAPSFGQAIFHLKDVNTINMLIVVITFLLVTFFDTAGTLIGMTQQAGIVDKDGKIPRIGRALLSDSLGMIVSSICGVSPLGTTVESSSGIAMGGRTGLTAVFTGFFLLIAMFFSPLLTIIPTTVTAPALIIVGVLMASNLAKISWDKFEMALPAFMIVLGMPLTYSISDGLALGIITYPITMIFSKRGKEVSPIMYILFFIFLIYLWMINI
ncbi:MAG: NCS2 family permease [Lactobacillus sp.]|nr:NCS2 family permease [Lactobacillus sp.]